jgi:uncharacterized membrane protein
MKTQKRKNKSQDRSAKIATKPRFYDRKKLWLEAIPIIIFLLMIIGALLYYPKIPNKIPTHWNATGQADGFGGRNSIFIIPIMFLVILILFFILPLMEVFRDNMIKIYKYFYAFKIIFSLFFAVLFVATLLPTIGYDINVSRVVIAMIGILFIALGFILPKLKRNFMFGIRTGWTMSSDKVWDKTHKIGGALFALTGIITIVLLFVLKLEALFWVFLTLMILVSLFLVFYSYYLYKKSN